MDDLVLELNRNKTLSMPTPGLVCRIIVPAGARNLAWSSTDEVFWETPELDKEAGSAEEPDNQFWMPAGMYDLALVGTGEAQRFAGALDEPVFFYFVPSKEGQMISFRASTVS